MSQLQGLCKGLEMPLGQGLLCLAGSQPVPFGPVGGWLGWEAAGAPLLGGMVPLLDVSCCIKKNTVVLAGFHRS